MQKSSNEMFEMCIMLTLKFGFDYAYQAAAQK